MNLIQLKCKKELFNIVKIVFNLNLLKHELIKMKFLFQCYSIVHLIEECRGNKILQNVGSNIEEKTFSSKCEQLKIVLRTMRITFSSFPHEKGKTSEG